MGKLSPRGKIQRHAHLGCQDARVSANAHNKRMYGHRVELCKSTRADTTPNARPATHVGRSLNMRCINSLKIISIPPAAQVRRSRRFAISCCSAMRAWPQARRCAGSTANMQRFRHLATASARNSWTSSLIGKPLGACLLCRCFQCFASRQRACGCKPIEMSRRAARLA
jgi:hypothetical protein